MEALLRISVPKQILFTHLCISAHKVEDRAPAYFLTFFCSPGTSVGAAFALEE